MDVAQFDVGITHQPVAALSLEDAGRFTDQRLTDKDQLTRPFDPAVAGHGARRNAVSMLSQRLVRPLVVVDRAEGVEPLLLRRQIGVRVGQGKRIGLPAVDGAGPPFEIGAPHVVGRAHCRKRLGVGRTPQPPARPRRSQSPRHSAGAIPAPLAIRPRREPSARRFGQISPSPIERPPRLTCQTPARPSLRLKNRAP